MAYTKSQNASGNLCLALASQHTCHKDNNTRLQFSYISAVYYILNTHNHATLQSSIQRSEFFDPAAMFAWSVKVTVNFSVIL